MKIIISHDVDHIDVMEHIFTDLIVEKFWVRSLLELLSGKIRFNTFINRLVYPFQIRYHRIQEVMIKDKQYHIPSTFFFGMKKGLGMSYGSEKAVSLISEVKNSGFSVGVHGIEYKEIPLMLEEYNLFGGISNENKFGIRMHYVRYDKNTFEKLSDCGYYFDTSEFDKEQKIFKKPYKVNSMWEFPLHIMDGYALKEGDLEYGKIRTEKIIKQCRDNGLPYCVILFHDSYYNEKCYPVEKKWYDWLLDYLKNFGYEFISYEEAIKEMETGHGE